MKILAPSLRQNDRLINVTLAGLMVWLAGCGFQLGLCRIRAADAPLVDWEHDQIRPAAAFNSQQSEHLVVWEDHHWGWGSDWDIYARRVAADGSAIGGSFAVAWATTNRCLAPDVCYNRDRDEYLVVYEYEYSASDHDIYARRVGGNGSLVGEPIPVATAVNWESFPRVTYDPDQQQYLVCWQRREGADEFVHDDIHARYLNGEGMASGGAFAVAVSALDKGAVDVACAISNSTSLVVWQGQEPGTGEYGVYGQVLGTNGNLVGGPISISVWEYDQLRPRVVFNTGRGEFLVVWEDHHWGWGGNYDIYGQRLHPLGPLIGDKVAISWLDDTAEQDRINPDVTYDSMSDTYWVAWGFATSIDQRYVGCRQLASNGSLLSAERVFAATAASAVRPAVAAGTQGNCLVVWEDQRSAATRMIDLYHELLAANGPGIDLQVGHVEVTQGIQCKDNPLQPDNSVPLIARKPTFVRVYVQIVGSSPFVGPVPNVSARVVAHVGGSQVDAIALNPGIVAKPAPQRAKFGDTLNFYLPPDVVAVSGQLEVEVNPGAVIPEINQANNTRTMALNFVTTPPLKVVPVRVLYQYGTNNHVVDPTMPASMSMYLRNILPIAQVQWHGLAGPPLVWTNRIGPDGGWGEVLAKLADLKKKNSAMPADAQWYAMLPFAQVEGNAGLAAGTGQFVSMGRVPLHHENLEDAADIMAHELAHNFGRGHAPCGVTPFDTNYPHAGARIADVGWDPQGAAGGKVASLPSGYVVPNTAYDLMSYCQDEWISEYTYRGILNFRGFTPALASSRDADLAGNKPAPPRKLEGETRPYLFLSGTIQVRNDIPQLLSMPATLLDRPVGFDDEAGGSGRAEVILLNDRREALFSRRFAPLPAVANGGPPPEDYPFSQALPWDEQTLSIQLFWDRTLLEERTVSRSAPTVAIDAPPEWTAEGEYLIRFDGADRDGDALTYDVEFSPDGGATWQMFANGLSAPELLLRSDQFPGTPSALLRVHATDGVLSASALSSPIAIEPKSPRVVIVSPARNTSLGPGNPLILRAQAEDPEDGALAPDAFAWRSDRDGFLGTGNDLVVELSRGPHELTVTAADSQRNEATATVQVIVGLRILSLNIGPDQRPTLTWESLPGLRYRILAAGSLDQLPTDISGPIAAEGPETTWSPAATPPPASSRFFLLEERGD